MKGPFKKVILSVFVILFILTSLPIASLGKNNSLPDGLPLTELSINPDLYAENIISIPLNFNKRNLSIEAKTDGIEIILDSCKNMNIPDYPALPYFEKELKIPEKKDLVYIKVKEVETQAIPLPKNAPLKLANRPEPIFQTEKDLREWIPVYTGMARRGMDSLFQGNDGKGQGNEIPPVIPECIYRESRVFKKEWIPDQVGDDRTRE